MKKAYQKPELIFDCFELSSSIAAGCEMISNSVENVCAVKVGDDVVYITDFSVCTHRNPDDLCYHVPTDALNVFSS